VSSLVAPHPAVRDQRFAAHVAKALADRPPMSQRQREAVARLLAGSKSRRA